MELQPIDYTQHASSQLCQMSFSDLLNQTSNNFDYNINSVSFISFDFVYYKTRNLTFVHSQVCSPKRCTVGKCRSNWGYYSSATSEKYPAVMPYSEVLIRWTNIDFNITQSICIMPKEMALKCHLDCVFWLFLYFQKSQIQTCRFGGNYVRPFSTFVSESYNHTRITFANNIPYNIVNSIFVTVFATF